MKYICPDCGKQYESGKFCPDCGSELQALEPELVCPSCGFKAKSGKFCPECGTKFEEQYGTSAVAAKSDAPERKFNERDPRFAKYYGKKGFPRTLPQEERAVAIEELTPYAEQNIAEAKMLLGLILFVDPDSAKDGLSLLKEAEAAGDMFAYYIMGVGFLYGLEPVVNQDIDEAEKRLLELNKEYDGEENDTLAELYAFYKIDYKKAFQYATAAADNDEDLGYFILGHLYLNGLGVAKDVQKAFENYKMAAAFGNAIAMNQIGWLFAGNDNQFKADPEQAFYWYNESAKKGSDVGMYNVGSCYQNGIGVKKDDEIAAEWFKKSAELGYVNAMNELGDYYQNVIIDLEKAESWYRKGADLGDAECQNKLGVLLDKNLDCEEANSWYQKAMEQNQPNAYNNYALNLWEGNGVEEDKQKAIELKEKAIELGLDALGLEGEINGLGVWYAEIGNYKKANECYLKAIDQENPWGYYNYGGSLWSGTGVEMNKDKAIEFLSKAAEMGLEEAQKELEEIQSKTPPKTDKTEQSATLQAEPPVETKPTQSNQVRVSIVDESDNHRITWLIIILLLIGVAVGGIFYYSNIYIPQKRDAEAPRYYTFANSVRMRSSADFEVEYNKLESFGYGTEVIVYDSMPGNYFYGKVAPKDARGKVIKDRVVEGYMAYSYLLPKEDFFRLNGIFGNSEAKEMLNESRYRRALLNYLKSHNYCGKITAEQIVEHNLNSNLNSAEQWQVFCKDKASKSNTVYRSRKYNKHSKYPDLAVIIKNVRSSERRLLYFIFDDETEAPELRGEQAAPAQGYMVDGTLTLQDWGHDGIDINVRYTN